MFDRSQKHNHRYVPELAVCGVLVLFSLNGMIWYETSGLLKGDIDGILLLAICLLIGSVFSVQFLMIARSVGWLKFHRSIRAKKEILSNRVEELHAAAIGEQLADRTKYRLAKSWN